MLTYDKTLLYITVISPTGRLKSSICNITIFALIYQKLCPSHQYVTVRVYDGSQKLPLSKLVSENNYAETTETELSICLI